MTNEEAIKFLKNISSEEAGRCIGKEGTFYAELMLYHIEALHLAIKALEERPNGKWIPVAERLPEEDEEYLATIQDGYKRYIGVAWYVGRGEWHYCGETMKVIAWQRLPSIYGNER